MPRREFLSLPAAAAAAAGDPMPQNIIPAPDDPAQWPEFRRRLAEWREGARRKLGYNGALYSRNDFQWVPRAFSCCFVMLLDETFYDPRQGRYTVDSFLDTGIREFGGFDGLVLWHAYPKIGIDARNQFDFYRDMPGGLAGLREVTAQCHRRGVRVYIDYHPWDTGTRREGVSDLDALIGMLKALDADGIFLDTMSKGAAEFRARLDRLRGGIVLEGEGALPLENIHDHHMSWAQWFRDSRSPGVLRNKWFERRHTQHQIERWNRDHTAELHTAWMNGSGMMVWENVFGTWVGWSERDKSIYRSMLPVQRRYARLFAGEGWTPLVPTLREGVYASLWEQDGMRLWALVNRTEETVEGELLRIEGGRAWDLIAGAEVRGPVLAGCIRPRGVGAFLYAAGSKPGRDFGAFLKSQAELDRRASFDTGFPARTAALAPPPAVSGPMTEGMAPIGPAEFDMRVEMRIRECGFYDAQHEHFAGPGAHALHKPILFERRVRLPRYAIDLTPVTNAQFARFLSVTGYKPAHPENFLKHWADGAPPADKLDHPVVYVDIGDARAYAKWCGKRLPTEEEWQYAAQGPEARRYPWGAEMAPDRANSGETAGTTPVMAFPAGRSPFGCNDMCGNVWEMTGSERSDGRTRFLILRGGSWYEARGSVWYVDGGPRHCGFAAKYLLMWPGLDRAATVGFRCAIAL